MFEIEGTTGRWFKRELPMCPYHGDDNGIKHPQNKRLVTRPRARDGSSQICARNLVPDFSDNHRKNSIRRHRSEKNVSRIFDEANWLARGHDP